MRVLVLDDDLGVLLYLKTVLRPIPKVSKVSTASHEKAFSKLLEEGDYDFIISDVLMRPTMGPDILRKHKEKIGNTPIMLISCSDDLVQVEDELLEERFNIVGSFQKPILPLTFLEFFND